MYFHRFRRPVHCNGIEYIGFNIVGGQNYPGKWLVDSYGREVCKYHQRKGFTYA